MQSANKLKDANKSISPKKQTTARKLSTEEATREKELIAYQTGLGKMYRGQAEEVLTLPQMREYEGKVQLIFTSPPFPLKRKKKYGNRQGEAYIEWLASFAPLFRKLLTPDGSIVIEVGNAWEPGRPVMSTLGLRALLEFLDRGEFHLCQQFVADNPARVPGPAQWVNIDRMRVKDSFTHIWWMSPTERPNADNRRVLEDYSPSMRKLLSTQKYNAGKRPSEHVMGERSFLKDNGGAIPPNVLVCRSVLTSSNTASSDDYLKYCRKRELTSHPARMPKELPEFFIRFLTNPGDLVLDPFGGSNMTGAVAESLGRRWVSIEPRDDYIDGSKGRFPTLRENEAPVEPLFAE